MKKFRYRFPVTIIVFIIIGLAACAAAIAFNIYLCITEGTAEAVNPALPVVQYTLTFLVSIAAGTILLGILCRSYYGVGDKKFRAALGFIHSNYSADDIESLVLNRENDKLTVCLKDGSCLNIIIDKEKHADFVQAVLDENPAAEYSIISLENKPDDKKNKK